MLGRIDGRFSWFNLCITNGLLIASSGLITGIAASLSMAASEYLSQRAEEMKMHLNLRLYWNNLFNNSGIINSTLFVNSQKLFLSLVLTLIIAVIIILGFNFYISVAKDLPFKKRFLEMAGISFGVAGLTFFIGFLVRVTLGIEI